MISKIIYHSKLKINKINPNIFFDVLIEMFILDNTIAPFQTLEGFYLGESVPVNKKLSEIFAQLGISDKSGRKALKIVENYSRNAFEFRDNSIVVTIPFNYNRKVGDKVGNKIGDNPITRKHWLNLTRERII